MNGPLSGYRILDLTTVVLGPCATRILGDMGADVVKVEPPEGGLLREAGLDEAEIDGLLRDREAARS